MKRVPPFRITALAGLSLLLGACASRQQNPAQLAPDVLYEMGSAAYARGDWDETIRLFDVFVNQHIGDPRAPEARMQLGRAYMQEREYVTAATHFQRLVNDYPFSPFGLEARFLTCDAYRRLSPRPALDQEYTNSALAHCESVANNFPGTPEAEQAAAFVADLREKLARKMFETGDFYFRRRAYDSAVVYFTDVLEQFPNTTAAPEALAQLVETYTRIGYVEDAQEARDRLLQQYPQSEQAQALRP